mmetsp:Transcript_13989/g.15454  ORF Transcript_13989/g.15454 Transcript_13989/m.15454 type:complete len:362 (-) Transcript_13989:54-1139(-)
MYVVSGDSVMWRKNFGETRENSIACGQKAVVANLRFEKDRRRHRKIQTVGRCICCRYGSEKRCIGMTSLFLQQMLIVIASIVALWFTMPSFQLGGALVAIGCSVVLLVFHLGFLHFLCCKKFRGNKCFVLRIGSVLIVALIMGALVAFYLRYLRVHSYAEGYILFDNSTSLVDPIDASKFVFHFEQPLVIQKSYYGFAPDLSKDGTPYMVLIPITTSYWTPKTSIKMLLTTSCDYANDNITKCTENLPLTGDFFLRYERLGAYGYPQAYSPLLLSTVQTAIENMLRDSSVKVDVNVTLAQIDKQIPTFDSYTSQFNPKKESTALILTYAWMGILLGVGTVVFSVSICFSYQEAVYYERILV